MTLLSIFSSTPGYSSAIGNDPRRAVARKRELEVQVRFVHVACTVQSREGLVHAQLTRTDDRTADDRE